MLAETTGGRESQRWGWKEPNTHVVIERILEPRPEFRYIHFTRHPLDMAYSENQYQLANWGPILLNKDIDIDPEASLAFWCAANRRIARVMRRYPDRTLQVDFEALCLEPDRHFAGIADFLGEREVPADVTAIVDRDRPGHDRFRTAGLAHFDPQDISYINELGYAVE